MVVKAGDALICPFMCKLGIVIIITHLKPIIITKLYALWALNRHLVS